MLLSHGAGDAVQNLQFLLVSACLQERVMGCEVSGNPSPQVHGDAVPREVVAEPLFLHVAFQPHPLQILQQGWNRTDEGRQGHEGKGDDTDRIYPHSRVRGVDIHSRRRKLRQTPVQ